MWTGRTANLCTKIMDFRGFDSSRILIGWNSQAHGELPRKFESSNLSRDNLSREIGRMWGKPLTMLPDSAQVSVVLKDDVAGCANTPCGGEVLHVCCKMSRTKHPM